jgi:hypothetical protein
MQRRPIVVGLGSALAAVIGACVIVIPAIAYALLPDETRAFLPLFDRAVRGFRPQIVLPLLFLAGFLITYITRQQSFLQGAIVGIATVISMPL